MHPLDGPFLKLRRAEEHLEVADDLVKGLKNRKIYRVVTDFVGKGQTRECLGRFEQLEELPPDLSLIIGDICNNLRSALDHLIWQLHLLRDPSIDRAIYFPICDTPSLFKGKESYVRGLTQDQRTAIEHLQPYWTKKVALSVLRDVNDSDKHRLIQVIGLVGELRGIRVTIDQTKAPVISPIRSIRYHRITPGAEIKDGAIVARIPLNGFSQSANVRVQSRILVEYAFAGGKLAKPHVIKPSLDAMFSEVHHALTLLEPEFAHKGTSTFKI